MRTKPAGWVVSGDTKVLPPTMTALKNSTTRSARITPAQPVVRLNGGEGARVSRLAVRLRSAMRSQAGVRGQETLAVARPIERAGHRPGHLGGIAREAQVRG